MFIVYIVIAVFELLTLVLSFLPDDTLNYPDVTSFGSVVGGIVGPFDLLFPVSEVAAVTVLSLTVVAPALLTYRLVMWLWKKIPVVGG